jgi:hypothetical protein
VEGSFEVLFREFLTQGENPITPYEIFKQIGAAAAWVTTNADGGEVFTLGIRFTVRSPTTGEQDERITFAKVYHTKIDFAEGTPSNKLTVAFRDFETAPSIDKVAEGS